MCHMNCKYENTNGECKRIKVPFDGECVKEMNEDKEYDDSNYEEIERLK